MTRTRECTQEDIEMAGDVDVGTVSNSTKNHHITNHEFAAHQLNPTYQYYDKNEKLHGFLSQQFPTIANPAPLGLFSFAVTTWIYSMSIGGVIISINAKSNGVVYGAGLFYGGLCQFLAGLVEFRTGNTFGTVALTSYGAFWMSTAALNIKAFGFMDPYGASSEDLIDINNAYGIYNLAWAIFSLLMLVCAHRSTVALVVLFVFVTTTFTLVSISKFLQGDLIVQRAGGISGIITSTIAGYCAVAALLTKKNSLFTLPVGDMDTVYRYMGILPELDEEEEKILVKHTKSVKSVTV